MSKLSRAEERFEEERDRRYSEVAEARAEALKIKERADEKALDLSAEVQRYKDAKANELREQIGEERSEMATKSELAAAVERFDERGSDRRLNAREIVIGVLLVFAGLAAAISPHIH